MPDTHDLCYCEEGNAQLPEILWGIGHIHIQTEHQAANQQTEDQP